MEEKSHSAAGTTKRALVKQALSGDSIVLLGPPIKEGGPPKELTVYLSNVAAARLAKRPIDGTEGTQDEPYAWEAREFLRKKVVGQNVFFVCEFVANSGREHGKVLVGGQTPENSENVAELSVSEGFLEVRTSKQPDEYIQKLLDLQENAKAAKKGRWSTDSPAKHIRSVNWVTDMSSVLDKYVDQKIDAVVEQVRDGSTIRAFLLPNFEYVTVALSGIKSPGVRVGAEGKPEEYGEEAKFFVEMRILQRDVKIILEGMSNQNLMGTVLHPKGNISEFLLKEGYAKCVDKSINMVKSGAQVLREAEKYAKSNRLRLWRSYKAPPSLPKNSYTAEVVEIGHGDSLTLLKDNGEELKIYFSSLRPPPRREVEGGRQYRPLFDTPFMFEAREFLRKMLIGKRVTVTCDYIQPKTDNFPEKTCVTVLYNGLNIAEALITKGLARATRHRGDDENRSPYLDALIAAEAEAEKNKKGLWSADKENTGLIRVQELQNELQRSKQFLPFLQRGSRPEGIVEFVASGSRLRVFIPKESILITFLLSGIQACLRTARRQDAKANGSDYFADEATKFTKSKCFQRDVSLEVESLDKVGGFIGYLFIQTEKGTLQNVSEMLVEKGLASVHFTAERSSHYNSLVAAEKRSKEAKLGIWKNHIDEDHIEKIENANDVSERKLNFRKIVVSEVLSELHFAAQMFENGPLIEKLMNVLQTEMKGSIPLTSAKRGQLAAAQFGGANNLWHRVRIEGVRGENVDVFYIDFGNRELTSLNKLATLPAHLQVQPPYSKEFKLALVNAPNEDYAADAKIAFSNYCFSKQCYFINTEYSVGNIEAVTLYYEENGINRDVGKYLVLDGYGIVEKRREPRLQNLVSEYTEAENDARKNRRAIWRYGDFTGVDF